MPLCPVLTTERLILRPFTANDIDAIFTLYSDEKTNTFLPWFPIKTRQEAEDLFARRYAAPPRTADTDTLYVCAPTISPSAMYT